MRATTAGIAVAESAITHAMNRYVTVPALTGGGGRPMTVAVM